MALHSAVTGQLLRHPYLPALLLGGLAATGFAPLYLWPVALICFALWMWMIHEAPTLKRALLIGWLFGLGHHSISNSWIAQAFTYQDAMPHWLGLLAPVLLSLYLAIYPMLAAGLAWRLASPRAAGDLATPPGSGFVLVFGAAWIATEYLRGVMLTGYPWNPLSEIWLPLIGIARSMAVTGTYALSGLTIVVAGALVLLTMRRWRLAAIVAVPLVLLALGGIDIRQTSGPVDPNAPRVRVVQPNSDQEQRPRDDYAETNLTALQRLSGTPGPAPRLIMWPEGGLRFLVEDGYPPQYYWRGSPYLTRQRIAAQIGPNDIVLAGGDGLKFDAAGTVTAATNSVFAINARGQILRRYDKAHLVPWGEYLPARPLMSAIGLSRLVPGDLDFAPGKAAAGLTLPVFGPVGFQICYEIIFSGEVVDRAHRPAFIFNPSNDSWYSAAGPAQNLAQARMRAIEEGLPVIRSTPTGISVIIDAHGRLLATVAAETAGAAELPIPPAAPLTLFARIGNWMALIVAAAMLILAVAIRRMAR